MAHKSISDFHPYWDKKKLKFFLGFFLVSFFIITLLIILFKPLRNTLHNVSDFTKTDQITEEDIFIDVPATHKNAKAIFDLKQKGVIQAYPNGTFQPTYSLKRSEFIKMLVMIFGIEPHGLTNSYCFSDVKNEWFAPYICYAKNRGWVNGYKNGRFYPENEVTTAEVLKMTFKAFKIDPIALQPLHTFADVKNEEWYAPYVWTAQEKHWLEKNPETEKLEPNVAITRAQAAELLDRMVSSELLLF